MVTPTTDQARMQLVSQDGKDTSTLRDGGEKKSSLMTREDSIPTRTTQPSAHRILHYTSEYSRTIQTVSGDAWRRNTGRAHRSLNKARNGKQVSKSVIPTLNISTDPGRVVYHTRDTEGSSRFQPVSTTNINADNRLNAANAPMLSMYMTLQ